MKLKTFCKAMISVGVFLLFCTFPGINVRAEDAADSTYCKISYEYLLKSADGTIALADGMEKVKLDNENTNPSSYDLNYGADVKELELYAFETGGYYNFKGWYETEEKAMEEKETDQVRFIPSDLSSENRNKDITLYASLEEIVYTIEYKLDPGDSGDPGPDPAEIGSDWNNERNPSTYTAKDVEAGKLVYGLKNQFRTVSGVKYLAASFSGWHAEGEKLTIGSYRLRLPDNGRTLILYAQYACKWIFYDPDAAPIQQTVKDGQVALSGMIYPGAQVYAPEYTLPDDTKKKICSGLSKGGELLGAYQVRLLCPVNPLNPTEKNTESRWDVPHIGDLDLTWQVAIPDAAAYKSDGFQLCQIEADQSFTCIPLKKSKDQGTGSEGTWYEAKITALTERGENRAFAVTGIRRADDHKYSIIYQMDGGENDPANPDGYTIEDAEKGKIIVPAKDQMYTLNGNEYLAGKFVGWYKEGTDPATASKEYRLSLADTRLSALTLYALYDYNQPFYNGNLSLTWQTVKDNGVTISGRLYPDAFLLAPDFDLTDSMRKGLNSRLGERGKLLGAYNIRIFCPRNPLDPDQEHIIDGPYEGDLILSVAVQNADAYEADGFKLLQFKEDGTIQSTPLKKEGDNSRTYAESGTQYKASVTSIDDPVFAVAGILKEEAKPGPGDDKDPDIKPTPVQNGNQGNGAKKTSVSTGDNSNVWMLLAVMSAAFAAGISAAVHKYRRHKQH